MSVVQSGPLFIKTESSSSLQRCSQIALVIALLIVAVTAIAFLLLALPTNDDFTRATMVTYTPERIARHFWNHFGFLYMHWQGRWAAFGLESAILPHVNIIKMYPALIGALAIIDLTGLFIVCRLFTRSASKWYSLACTLGLAAVLWAQLPSLAQTANWFVGGIENVMVFALAGVLLVGLVRMRASTAWMIFASCLAIITTGLHEAYGAMLCIALAAGTLAAYWMASANRRAWLVVLLAATIGLGIVAGAPGNFQRMKSDGPKADPASVSSPQTAAPQKITRPLKIVAYLAGIQFWNASRAWIFDPKLIAAALFIAFSPRLEMARPVWTTSRPVPWRLLIPVTWVAMLSVGFFLPSFAFVEIMPPRTLSGNFIVFAIGWLLIVFVWTRKLDSRDSSDAPTTGIRSNAAASLAMLLLAASLVLTGNTVEGLHDLASRKVFHWHSSLEKRYVLLQAHRDQELVIPYLSPSSRLLYSGEMYYDPANWTNRSVADYFHVKSVRVLPPEIKTPTTTPVEAAMGSQNP